MSRRSLRHPFGGGRFYNRPASGRSRPKHRSRGRQPRIRPRRNVNVAALVGSPEEQSSRPQLRLQIVGGIVLVLFIVMILRLWGLTVIDGKNYAAVVNANQVRTVQVAPPRGLIVDRHATVLAGNEVQTEIVLSRAQAAAHPEVKAKVAALVGVTPAQIQKDITNVQYSPYEPVPVLENAPKATVEYLDTHRTEFPGVSVQHVTQRRYPQQTAAGGGTLAAHLLGYTSRITGTFLKAHQNDGYTLLTQVGKSGIEGQYEQYLHGVPGQQQLEVNAAGNVVGTLKETAATQGDTVVLNITANLQRAVQTALTQVMADDRKSPTPKSGVTPAAPNGAAVVMNANNGQVLALASNPTYSLTTWIGGISTAHLDALNARCTTKTQICPLTDEAIDGLYAPGSTFKLATATAALQDGLINTNTTIDDTGTFDLRKHGFPTCTGGCTYHDDTPGDTGRLNVTSALVRSDDYFFYTLGARFYQGAAQYGATAIQNTAYQYGFGAKTGIDLPGAAQGHIDGKVTRERLHAETPKLAPNTYWYPGTSVEMAFGQGSTVVTPIEEAQAYATFANGGTRYQPQVASKVVAPDGKVVATFGPKKLGHITVSPTNYQAMLQGFLGVVSTARGTAYTTFAQIAKFPYKKTQSYPIAGKTGTADVSKTTAVAPNAWFVGFGPTNHAGSEPEYVVVVQVAQGGYGAAAAAPAVAQIFNYLYANPVLTTPATPTPSAQPTTTLPAAQPPAGTPPPTTTTTTAPAGGTTTTKPAG